MNFLAKPNAPLLRIVVLISLSIGLSEVRAQVVLSSFGSTYTQDFNTLAISGTSSAVPVGWAFLEIGTGANTVYTAGTGSSLTGDTYSYGATSSAERAFGGLRSATVVPTVGASFKNTTGGVIGSLTIVYKGEQWRLGALNRTDRWDFQYSTNATALNNGTYIDFNPLDFTAPVQGPTVGALNGDVAPNFTVVNSVLSGLSLANNATIWIRWNDFDATGSDDGLSVDSFSVYACPAVTCPPSTSLCISAPPVILTGGSPGGGAYSGDGVTNGVFSPSAAGLGAHPITYTYTNGICSGNCVFTITVTVAQMANAGNYGPVCVMDPNVQLNGTPAGGYWTGLGIVNGNQFDPNAGTQTLTYHFDNGCASTSQTTITVNPCLMPPEMRWVLLNDMGQQNGTCTSQTNCLNNIICFGLQYTPNVTGTMSSYTTGFTIDCYNSGGNPVLSNSSCVLTNNSWFQDGCSQYQLVQWNFLGATPGAPVVTAGVPKVIHQVCFAIPNSGSVALNDFPPGTALTTSIDISPTNHVSEAPIYIPFSFDSALYCGLLPVRYLLFEADKFDELVSKLDWATAEELNNDHFEIERSNDKGLTFQSIGQVAATENPQSVNPYQFYDRSARPGSNLYRLKQFDRDGKFAYSPIRSVTFSSPRFDVKAWPSPTSDLLHVYISRAEDIGRLQLINLAGQKVWEQSVSRGDSAIEIAVDSFVPGIYSLVVTAGSNQQVVKILVSQ
jgi:hypothetical protein